MNSFEEPSAERSPGLSRRQLFTRLAGGFAGALVASAGLIGGKSYAAGGTISLRELMGRISLEGCDSSSGIRTPILRALFPENPSVISIRDMASRYDGKVNQCRGPRITVRTEPHRLGGYITITGDNFTPGGRVNFVLQGIPNYVGNYSIGYVEAEQDGTYQYVWDEKCGPALTSVVTVRAFDVQRNVSATGTTTALSCPPP